MTQSYLKGVDVVYWINLDRSPDRKDSMLQLFKDDAFDGIPNHRISAIDGSNPKNIDNMIILENKTKPDKVYGCLLSHLEAIRAFQESKHEIALILEDDVTLEFKKYWSKSVQQIVDEAPQDWEIIMLSYTLLPGQNKHPFWNWKYSTIVYYDVLTSSTVSYIINKKGANKLMSKYKNNKYNLELDPGIAHDSDAYLYLIAKTYCYKYPMFTYSLSTSTIHPGSHDVHVDAKNIIINNYESN